MPGNKMTEDTPTPWYRKVGLVILWPFFLPIFLLSSAIIFAMVLYVFVHCFVLGLFLYVRMMIRGRSLSWRQFVARIAMQGPGTLIIEAPMLGGGFTRAWWTPEKILTVCPYSEPTKDEWRGAGEKMQCLNWDRWHWEKYIDPAKGRGLLLSLWTGQSCEKWVRRNYPSVEVVNTWTALVHYPNPEPEPAGA
jgi:hypothetical protein